MKEPNSRKQLVTKFYYLFWWYYFPHYHNRSIPEYKVDQCLYSRHPRLLIIDARDHGKSANWSCGYPLWVGLTNPYGQPVENLPGGGFKYERHHEEVLCQVSCAGDLPEKWIRRHKSELRFNIRLIQDWGEQSTQNTKDGIWQNGEILLKNGAHIYSKGAGAQIRGDHPTEVIVDDLEDRKRSKNPDNRKKDREYFFADLFGALEPHSRLKVIGTVVHQEALLPYLYDREIVPPPGLEDSPLFKHPWAKFKYAAIKPDGTCLAPEIWSYERLMLRKAELPPSVWRSEYMNNPESSENPIFPRAWFNKDHNGYDRGDPEFIEKILPNLEIFSFCDPAPKTGESNDYTAIVTVGLKRAKRPVVYVLEVKRFRDSFTTQLAAAINTWTKWGGTLGFEGIAYQSVLKTTFDKVCEEMHYHPKVYETIYREKARKKSTKAKPAPIDKESRAHRVTKFLELGWLFFNYLDPLQIILMDDMVVFPNGDHDDTVDAVVGCLWEVDRVLEYQKEQEHNDLVIQIDETTGQPSYIFND